MVNNGKITARHRRGGNPQITIRIQDPDGISNFWVWVMSNQGQWVPVGKGTGNCANNVVFKVAINVAMVGQAHKVVYKDCQHNPAYEQWEINGQFTEWHDGERKDSGYDADKFEPSEDFPEEIIPESSSEGWMYYLLGGLFMLLLAAMAYRQRKNSTSIELPAHAR